MGSSVRSTVETAIDSMEGKIILYRFGGKRGIILAGTTAENERR